MTSIPLAELVQPAGKRAGAETDLPVYSVTKHSGFVPSLEYFSKQVFSRDVADYKLVEPGDFAYATIHLDEGSIGIAPERALISPMYTVFTTDDSRVDSRYLIRYLKSPRALAHYPQLGKGAIHRRKAISLMALGALPVPLPSLPEQRRIAAILDHADALCAKRRQVLTHLNSLIQSIFNDIFAEAEFDRKPIGSFADVRSGSTPSRKDALNFGGMIPWVKTTEVQGGLITQTSECVTEQGLANARLKVFPAGSVVVAMYGQGKTRGQSGILGIPAATNQACAVITPNETFIPDFLQAQLAVSYDRLRGEAEGGNQPNLSLGRVAAFEVILPPVDAQVAFVERLKKVNSQREFVTRAIATSEEVLESLQSRAFRGEL